MARGGNARAHTGQGIRSVIDVRRGWRRFPQLIRNSSRSRRVRENPGDGRGGRPAPLGQRVRQAAGGTMAMHPFRGMHRWSVRRGPRTAGRGRTAGQPRAQLIRREGDRISQHPLARPGASTLPHGPPDRDGGPCRLWTVDPKRRRRIRASSCSKRRVAVDATSIIGQVGAHVAAVAGLVTGPPSRRRRALGPQGAPTASSPRELAERDRSPEQL